MITLTIDGTTATVEPGTTILAAARGLGIRIPTLCFNEHLQPFGGCRLCIVDVASPGPTGRARMVSSCTYPVEEGLIVKTDTEGVKKARQFVMQLLIARAPESEELRKLALDCGIDTKKPESLDRVGRYLMTRAPRAVKTKCILCGQCVRVCSEVVKQSAITFTYRGTLRKIRTPFDRVNPVCVGCGSCAYLCPTKAITIEAAE